MPTCLVLPASWQTWSMLSTARSRVTVGLVTPRTQPFCIMIASKAMLIPLVDVVRIENGVATLHAQDEAERGFDRILLVGINVLRQVALRAKHLHVPVFFHRPVIGEMSVGTRVNRFRRRESESMID